MARSHSLFQLAFHLTSACISKQCESVRSKFSYFAVIIAPSAAGTGGFLLVVVALIALTCLMKKR